MNTGRLRTASRLSTPALPVQVPSAAMVGSATGAPLLLKRR